jgi:hypothetical protein
MNTQDLDRSIRINAINSANKIKEFDWLPEVRHIDEDLYGLFDKPDQFIHLVWDDLSNYNDLAHIDNFV